MIEGLRRLISKPGAKKHNALYLIDYLDYFAKRLNMELNPRHFIVHY